MFFMFAKLAKPYLNNREDAAAAPSQAGIEAMVPRHWGVAIIAGVFLFAYTTEDI